MDTGSIDLEKEKKEILNQYKGLIRACKPYVDKEGRVQIRKAFNLALEAHDGMRRKSGEPYIYHPIAVARIVAEEIGLGTTSIICALLHDTVEDTDITLVDIQKQFGTTRSNIIDGLTKLGKVLPDSKSMQADNFRKILLTLAEDIRVIIIKLADRLHNMRTMDSMPPHKQLKIASETLFLYAPMAHRLGLYNIKSELEDLSMKYTHPDIFNEISQKLAASEIERRNYIKSFIRPIKERLSAANLKVDIKGRPKSVSSIWTKMKKKAVKFEEVYDIFAIRILITTEEELEKSDCWKVYSIITDRYTPNPDRLRDWVSVPKANGYEALHTTVMGPKGKWVEVQIRSARMDQIAEKGIAAHWKYKENNNDHALDDWLKKIREVLDNPEADSIQFLDNVKLNLFSTEIYVFTPLGDMKVLPSGATVLDFAYDVHTELGNKCLGAKINHKVVPITTRLKNGDQIEIITSEIQQPTEEWLDKVVTAKAKSMVAHFINREKRGIARLGRQMLEQKFSDLKISLKKVNIQTVIAFYNKPTETDLFFDIGVDNINLDELDQLKIIDNKLKIPKTIKSVTTLDDRIKNQLSENANLLSFDNIEDDIDYGLAKCCNPIPGDEVVAINKEDGLEIHRTKCGEAIGLMSIYGGQIVKTKWSTTRGIAFLTGLKINGVDSSGVMYKITKVISHDLNITMKSISIEGDEGHFEGKIIVYVHNNKELQKLIDQLNELDFIISTEQLDRL